MNLTQKEHARLTRVASDLHASALSCFQLAAQEGMREKYLADIRNDLEKAEAVVEFLKANPAAETEKKICERYLGNRGIDQDILRCAYHDGLWFIVFTDAPDDIEVSKAGGCYECWDMIPRKGFRWTHKNFQAIKLRLQSL